MLVVKVSNDDVQRHEQRCCWNGALEKLNIILEWTTSLDTSSRTLFVREGGCRSTSLRTSSYVITFRLSLNVELPNYVISRQIVERRVT